MDDFDFNMTITIVGLGLIGGSLAYSLKAAGIQTVYGIDQNPDVLTAAKEQHLIIDQSLSQQEMLNRSDIVILCLYPSDELAFVEKHVNHFKADALITDVSGVKTHIHEAMSDLLPATIHYVGGHPMAGKEEGGFQNASIHLLNGCNYLLTNTIDHPKVNALKQLLETIGCTIVETTPQEHDQMIGLTSQIPHIIASILTRVNTFDDTKAFVGNSFDEMTRISLINEKLWSELFVLNHDNLEDFLKVIKDEIDTFINLLATEDQQAMQELLLTTKKKRQQYLNS